MAKKVKTIQKFSRNLAHNDRKYHVAERAGNFRVHRIAGHKRKKKHYSAGLGAPESIGESIMMLAGLAGGLIGSDILTEKFLPATWDIKYVGGGKLVAGLGIANFLGKNELLRGLSYGIAISGVRDIAKDFNLISGENDKKLYVKLDGGKTIDVDFEDVTGGEFETFQAGEDDIMSGTDVPDIVSESEDEAMDGTDVPDIVSEGEDETMEGENVPDIVSEGEDEPEMAGEFEY